MSRSKMDNTYVVRQKTEFKKYAAKPSAALLAVAEPVAVDHLGFYDRVAIAYALYDAGFAPEWSRDAFDELCCGYASNGRHFKYELMPNDFNDMSKGITPWKLVLAQLVAAEELE